MKKHYLDKQTIFTMLDKAYCKKCPATTDCDKCVLYQAAILINMMQEENVKPEVKGEWKQTGDYSAICTTCGKTSFVGGVDRTGQALIHKGLFQFCPNCGADMKGR